MAMTNVNTLPVAKAQSGSDSFNIFISDPRECKWHVNSVDKWHRVGQ